MYMVLWLWILASDWDWALDLQGFPHGTCGTSCKQGQEELPKNTKWEKCEKGLVSKQNSLTKFFLPSESGSHRSRFFLTSDLMIAGKAAKANMRPRAKPMKENTNTKTQVVFLLQQAIATVKWLREELFKTLNPSSLFLFMWLMNVCTEA